MTKNLNKALTPQNSEELIRFVEELKRQWMATIDALVDPVAIVLQDYTIFKANKAMAALTKKDVKEIIGKKCFAVFAKRKSPCSGCKMLDAAKGKSAQQFNLEEIRVNRFYEVTSQPILSERGKLEGVVQIYRDRTDARSLQQQLLQSEKLASIGLLAGGIAHEINNPLAGILVFSQMLLREMDKHSPHYQDVQEIYNATTRCKEIVENLLEFARQQPQKKKHKIHIDLKEAVKAALRFASVGNHKKRNIEIVEQWSDDELTILYYDHNKMIQVFLNLIQNAFQAMPDGGTLEIKGYLKQYRSQEQIVIEIADTGIGIPKDNIDKIFDPFFTTKDPGEGTGLGLAICYGIIDDASGSMKVQSKINVGTTFTVSLPYTKRQQLKESA